MSLAPAIFRPSPGMDRARIPHFHRHNREEITDSTRSMIEVSPSENVRRSVLSHDGMGTEIIRIAPRGSIEVQFHGPVHLVVLVEQGARRGGETAIDGLAPSNLFNLQHKFSFVPAGHKYYERQLNSASSHTMYFWFDTECLPPDLATDSAEVLRAPRLFFEDSTARQTALKLMRLVESSYGDKADYFKALGHILVHELLQSAGVLRELSGTAVRGGLAGWQERKVANHIGQNVAKNISLSEMAQLVRLSPYHFCRAFKKSFGVSPGRYRSIRRIQCAKDLLTKPGFSVTEVGNILGFSDTSSFSSAFRRVTGTAPTSYQRGRH
jgi:AraC family transcriptional regulator